MDKEKISVGNHVTVGEITLLPITRTFVFWQEVEGGVVCSGSKSLIGLVVVSPGSVRAMDADGSEVPVRQYIERVPELERLLRSV